MMPLDASNTILPHLLRLLSEGYFMCACTSMLPITIELTSLLIYVVGSMHEYTAFRVLLGENSKCTRW